MSVHLDRLQTLGATRLTAATVAEFLTAPDCLILVPGNPARVREANDAAVIFPDLVQAVQSATGRSLAVGFLSSEDETEALRAELGVLAYPCVIAWRNGAFAGVVAHLRPWSDYVSETTALFPAVAA